MLAQSPQPDNANPQELPEDHKDRKDKTLDKIASDAAKKGTEREKRYDAEHNVFTK